MSSSEDLFRIRNQLKKASLKDFKRYIDQERVKLSLEVLSNLLMMVYQSDRRPDWIEYLIFFAKLNTAVLHTQINQHRRLLEDLCFHGRGQQYREVFRMMLDSKADLKQYSLLRLIRLAIDGGKSNYQDSIIDTIHQVLQSKKHLGSGGEAEDGWLVKYALRREMMLVADFLIRHRVGRVSHEGDELFMLASFKIPKKDSNALYSFVEEYLEQNDFNARQLSHNGRTFYEKMSKDFQNRIEEIIRSRSRQREKKDVPVRRSQNKAKSSLGPGEHPKQYSESIGPSSKEVTINIQSLEDEKFIHKEASRIHKKYVEQKQKCFKYQKGQKKEAVVRTGILKSEELRYYLQEDIQYEVEKIKQQDKQLRSLYHQVLDRVTEHLSTTLDITMQVYGSFVTELALVESDIDLVAFRQKEMTDPVELLQSISFQMQKMPQYISKVQLIKTATVPIIKAVCTEKYHEKNIDITYKNSDHNGLPAIQLIRQYLKNYPQLEPLIFILKKFIYTSGLSAPYKGGLSSYGLVLMIVGYMQRAYKAKQLQGQQQDLLVADLLIGFLKFYGFKFNYVMKCITIVDHLTPQIWNKYTDCVAPYNSIDLQPRLAIIDPLNSKNNVGRSTHKIKQIQMAFEIAYICIHTFRACGRKRRCESYRKISKADVNLAFIANERPCCILKRMFGCTQKFIKE